MTKVRLPVGGAAGMTRLEHQAAPGTAPPPDPTTVGNDTRTHLLVPTLIFVALLVAVVSSLGAPLIPTIAAADHVAVGTAQWVLTAALVTGAAATPILGRLADGSRQRAL